MRVRPMSWSPTMRTEWRWRRESRTVPAHRPILAGCGLDALAGAVRAVHRGVRHLSPRVAARLADSLSSEPFTAREEEVLRLLVEGLSNKAIANRMEIASGTVKSHMKSIFDKLDVQSRVHAVAVVEKRGLLMRRSAAPDVLPPRTWRGIPRSAAHGAAHIHAE